MGLAKQKIDDSEHVYNKGRAGSLEIS